MQARQQVRELVAACHDEGIEVILDVVYNHTTEGSLDGGDPFLVLADYESYVNKQKELDAVFRNKKNWAHMAIMNTARVGKFSSDRTIHQYAEEVWKLKQVTIP